ncbi:hypothetical protein ACLB1G_24480 [Oxalobacteraceae bacterium A2-2]
MADASRIKDIMTKLRATLNADDFSYLQTQIDQLETISRAGETHHESHSSPNSHHSQHHSSVTDLGGILERIILQTLPQRG